MPKTHSDNPQLLGDPKNTKSSLVCQSFGRCARASEDNNRSVRVQTRAAGTDPDRPILVTY